MGLTACFRTYLRRCKRLQLEILSIFTFLAVTVVLVQSIYFFKLTTKKSTSITQVQNPSCVNFSFPELYPLVGYVTDYVHQMQEGRSPDVKPINFYNYDFILQNKTKCLKASGKFEKVKLLIVVKSAVPNHRNREAIRNTWGQENRFPKTIIKTVFLVGIAQKENQQKSIEAEHKKYGDIIQSDFIDTYYNNTIKTMQGIKWVMESCPSAQFILFADDDMYISVKNLLRSANKYFENGVDYLYMGNVFRQRPSRTLSSKWYISQEEYPHCGYPPFINAGAYILSYQSLNLLYYGSMFTKHFRFDDVFLGMVASKVNITLINNEEFFHWKVGYSDNRYKKIIASHGFNDRQLVEAWNKQLKLNTV